MRRWLAALIVLLSASASFAAPDSTIDPLGHALTCVTRLFAASGLQGDDSLVLGGDDGILLAYDRPHARAWVFTTQGAFHVDKALPRSGAASFAVATPKGRKYFQWVVKNGAASQSSNKSAHPDIVADKLAPPDDEAWAMIARIVKLKVPMTLKSLQEHRDFEAHKHMHLGLPKGYAESYGLCRDVGTGAIATEIASVVDSEYKKWQQLVATPVVFVKWEVVKRVDHPEWRACTASNQCTIAAGPCGWSDAIAKVSTAAYEKWTTQRGEQINCDMPEDEGKPHAICKEGQCIDPAMTPAPAWYECRADADCVVAMSCDKPVALSKRVSESAGVYRWQWFATVDGWDQCSVPVDPPKGAQARCVSNRCELR